jgi:glycogen operon protein
VIRRFVRGDSGLIGEAATRLCGSSDLYECDGRLPVNSINFITCHDGFTLLDLVSYNVKRNEANGLENRDGYDDNASWNCGVEGETDIPEVLSLRKKQAKNFMAVLLLSQGVPMILSGDEVLRTQRGNNNCFCQDNDMGWFDWKLIEENRDMLRFVTGMISFRKRHPSLMKSQFLTGQKISGDLPDITWHGRKLNDPRWNDPAVQVLACTLAGTDEKEEHLHILLNMSDTPVQMELPMVPGRNWYRAVDTSQPSPADIFEAAEEQKVEENIYSMAARTVVVLEGR